MEQYKQEQKKLEKMKLEQLNNILKVKIYYLLLL